MIKIRVFYDDQRELEEVIKLLSPRMLYCKTFPMESPKRALFGIDASDLLISENDDQEDAISESLTLPGESNLPEDVSEKGGQDNE